MTQENTYPSLSESTRTTISGNLIFCEIPLLHIVKSATNLYQKEKLSLKLITATDERNENGCFKIWYVFGDTNRHRIIILSTELRETLAFPSLSSCIHEAWDYERRIHTFFGLTPISHPDLRSLILHENWPKDIFPLRKDFDLKTRPEEANGSYVFQKVEGEGIYEIPVGPIHAGIIEPGHFRFSVAGESIVLLEARLGFTHKGSEKLFESLSLDKQLQLSEKISGDSSFSHSLAFCQAVEILGEVIVPKRALALRVIYAELERLANHFGDSGAMMTDTGFNFGGAHGARLRETVMQINERLTGSRFLRGVNTLGGVTRDITDAEKEILSKDITVLIKDFSEVIAIAENSTSLLNRMKETGTLSQEMAVDTGTLGVAGRASGRGYDTRVDYPYAGYAQIAWGSIPTEQDGDAYARFHIRIKESLMSMDHLQTILQTLPEGEICAVTSQNIILKKSAVAVSLVEGWRGEIVYFVATDANGNIGRVFPRDPSFVNWGALQSAAFDNVVPDFPLINKSFNLSYSGNDL